MTILSPTIYQIAGARPSCPEFFQITLKQSGFIKHLKFKK